MTCLILLGRGPGWSDGGGGVLGTLLHLTRYGFLVSPRVVAGGQEVAVVEARILIPGTDSAVTEDNYLSPSPVSPCEPVTACSLPTCQFTGPDVWEVWDSSYVVLSWSENISNQSQLANY